MSYKLSRKEGEETFLWRWFSFTVALFTLVAIFAIMLGLMFLAIWLYWPTVIPTIIIELGFLAAIFSED